MEITRFGSLRKRNSWRKNETDKIKRNKCPICGGEIIVSEFLQKSRDYKVLKNGKLSKRYTVQECGSMDLSTAACVEQCGAYWEEDEFAVGEDGSFYDKKYVD